MLDGSHSPLIPESVSYMIPQRPRVVLDTSVLVAGLRSRRGASNRLLQLALTGEVTALLSNPLLLEYESVLTRPRLVPFGVDDVEAFLSGFAAAAECRMVRTSVRPFLPDPNDDHVLDLAVSASADAIVTFNTRDFRSATKLGIPVLTPAQYLSSR